MASRGKKKTTMAKLNRERKLRERRLDKQAKKDARQHASAQHPQQTEGALSGGGGHSIGCAAERPALEPVAQSHSYA
jgi:hypothetical protein